jgi:hypothetical protein
VQLEEPFRLFLLGCHGPKVPVPSARVDRLPPPDDTPRRAGRNSDDLPAARRAR